MSEQNESMNDDERRIAPRARTLKRAKILFNNNFSTFDCVVRNISATGALLTIDSSAHLPKTFDIRIGDETHSRPAELVYRRELFAGIHFLDIGSSSDHPSSRKDAKTPRATPAAASEEAAVAIRRIVPGTLPPVLTRLFPWF